VLVDFVVELGQAQLGAGHFLEDVPVCLHVLDDFDLLASGVAVAQQEWTHP
jgi:hypothetical protein